MKSYIFLFSFLNSLCMKILGGELCRTSTTLNPYMRYHKCASTDVVYQCDNCDDYQPSCKSDSDCENEQACCQASCYPSSCYQCQCIFLKF